MVMTDNWLVNFSIVYSAWSVELTIYLYRLNSRPTRRWKTCLKPANTTISGWRLKTNTANWAKTPSINCYSSRQLICVGQCFQYSHKTRQRNHLDAENATIDFGHFGNRTTIQRALQIRFTRSTLLSEFQSMAMTVFIELTNLQ